MPGTLSDAPLKRKRSKTGEKPKKRARSESGSDDEHQQANILLLENEILESKKNYNNITVLLELSQNTQDAESALVATVSLCRVFLRLLASGNLTRNAGQSEKEVVVVQWLKSRLSDYKEVVLTALVQEDTASTALTLAMRILKAEGQHLSSKEDYTFPKVYLKEIVSVLVHDGSEDLRQEFCEKFVGEFCDVRFYTFKALKDVLSDDRQGPVHDDLFGNAFDILSFFEDVPTSVDELGEFYIDPPKKKNHPVATLTQQKKQGQEAWHALLNLGPNREQRKQVLEIMTQSIAPWFTKPELLADFLTDSYNSGGSISLLALSGVFYLIQHRNLDYPSFYRKLYSLLDAEILHSKHRSKFLRLLDTFLASTHLPSVLVASFIKRLSRLCLNAPPAAIVAIIPWIYNLFKKHPLCTFMIHRVTRTDEEKALIESEGLSDPFDADELDPMETHAIDSCLWEVAQLQSHYHPNVATIAKIISEQFTKQSYNIEDFLDHSYTSVSQICRCFTCTIVVLLTITL
jgi:U3 small nucleolar RNA-associated protein 19